jgi:CheY-like chemotaxis protein
VSAQKILIVDDSRLIRMQVREMLPAAGNVQVLEAQDGAEGLTMIQKEHPTLIVMDCFMPNMNGWQVVHKMQSYPDLQSIPIVMMSGREEDVVAEAPELFAYFEFLAKPFDKSKLFQAIKAAMNKAGQRKAKATTKATPQGGNEPTGDAIATVKSDLQRIDRQNAILRAEVEQLRQQVTYLTAVVRQQLGQPGGTQI